MYEQTKLKRNTQIGEIESVMKFAFTCRLALVASTM